MIFYQQRKGVFRYVVLIVLVSWTMAGVIPDRYETNEWMEIIPPLERRVSKIYFFNSFPLLFYSFEEYFFIKLMF